MEIPKIFNTEQFLLEKYKHSDSSQIAVEVAQQVFEKWMRKNHFLSNEELMQVLELPETKFTIEILKEASFQLKKRVHEE